jgi:uncharacterized protein with FMN-binding domain
VVIAVKKIVLWFMSTVSAMVLLFGYHTSTSSQASATAESSAVAPVDGSSTGSTSTGTKDSSGTATAPSDSGTSSSTSSGSSSSSASGTVTGDVASTRWGPVQVQLTIADGKITDVEVVQYPDNNGKDRQINARALPTLIRETLSAQSDNIDMVSGATVTSDGYVQSLQSALDKAGL